MKRVRTQDAVGQTLCHDITRIIKGVSKGVLFSKGHIIAREDIPLLLSVGKDHVYIWENDENMLHENDAAQLLKEICFSDGMRYTGPKEGKIELIAERDGLYTVDLERLRALNSIGEIVIATRSSGFPVKKGDVLCGMRVVPLVIKKSKMDRAKKLAGDAPIMRLLPIKPKKYGIITTGNEVYNKRIEDTFTPVIREKLGAYGGVEMAHKVLDDDHAKITAAIHDMLSSGAELVLCCGGMSVDPDDRTPLAIKNSTKDIVTYGAPVLPGAMFMLAYSDDGRPICGLPGCVMYAKRTIFDIVLPWLLADVRVDKEQLYGLGNGGLCLNCPDCRYPNCGFGKGV